MAQTGRSFLARGLIGAALAFSALTFLAWLPANLAMPLGRDQGIFAFVGQAILDGGLPYIDAWEHKGPATHFLYAAGMGAFGSNALGIRLFDIALTIGMAAAAWGFGRVRGRPLWGLITGLFVWVIIGGNFWHTAQVEGWLAYAHLLAMLALWMERTRTSRTTLVVVGVVLAIGVLIKPNFVLMAPMVLVACGWQWRPLMYVAIGGISVLGATFALFAAAGGLGAFWDAVVVFNVGSHVTRGTWSLSRVVNLLVDPFIRPNENVAAVWVLEALALIGAGLMWRSDRRGFWILTSGAVCGWLIGISQVKGFYYHSMTMYVVVAAFAAEAASRALTDDASDLRARLRDGFVAFAAVALIVVTPQLYGAVNWWQFKLGRTQAALYERLFCEDYDELGFCHRDLALAAAFVRASTRPSDTMYVWGMEALMHLETQRRSPTRFGFNYGVVGGTPAYAAVKKAEIMVALNSRPPAAIVVQENDRSNITPLTAREALASFPELEAVIDRDYRRAFANTSFTVYLRR
jgi:hypothetical protein